MLYSLLVGGSLLVLAALGWIIFSRLSRGVSSRKGDDSGFWPRLVRTTSQASSFDELLSLSLRVLAEKYRADRGIVSKYSRLNRRLHPVEVFGPAADEWGILASGEGSKSIFWSSISGRYVAVVTGPAGKPGQAGKGKTGPSWLTIPIVDRRETLAVLALAGGDIGPADGRLLREAKSIQGVISCSAANFLAAAVGAIYRDSARTTKKLIQVLSGCSSIKEALAKVTKVLRELSPVDFVSLSRSDPQSRDEIRWSALVDGGRLVEWHYPVLYKGAKEAPPAGATVPPVIDHDLKATPQPPAAIESRCGMRSRLVLPLMYGERPMATLIIAHRQPGKYDEATLTRLEGISRVFAEWLHTWDTEARAHRTDRYLDVLDRLDNLDQDKIKSLIDMLRRAMEVTMVRLFRYDPIGRLFTLVASSSARPSGKSGPAHLRTPAERLPWHRHALSSRRVCLIDQDDPERLMSTEEGRLAMIDSFKTSLLVPVYHGERSLGILTVAEMRRPARRRFEAPDYVFLRCAAARIGRFLAGDGLPSSVGADMPVLRRTASLLAAPLTTLCGSVELIRQHNEDIDEQTSRYLANIERAGERIKEVTQDSDDLAVPERRQTRKNAALSG